MSADPAKSFVVRILYRGEDGTVSLKRISPRGIYHGRSAFNSGEPQTYLKARIASTCSSPQATMRACAKVRLASRSTSMALRAAVKDPSVDSQAAAYGFIQSILPTKG